jgi:hypothetical protein
MKYNFHRGLNNETTSKLILLGGRFSERVFITDTGTGADIK